MTDPNRPPENERRKKAAPKPPAPPTVGQSSVGQSTVGQSISEKLAAHQPAPAPAHLPTESLPSHLVTDLLNSPIFDLSDTAVPGAPLPDAPAQEAEAEHTEFIPELVPMYPAEAPFLARFLPRSAPMFLGLNAQFCDLHAFLTVLHERRWHGYLHAAMGEEAAYVLLYEGRTVTAAATGVTGEQALAEFLRLYDQGADLSAHPLSPTFAHVLSGVGSRAWKFNLTEDFTGLHARPTGAIFYAAGEIVATMPTTLPYEGAFPAPLRPQTLILPRSLAGWAHHTYTVTLRGRDALNAITDIYLDFKGKYGAPGQALLRAISQGQTPAEYALQGDLALHELEPLLNAFIQAGYLKDE